MPTFKLEEMDEDLPYGGDNDMYFRQWRLPSMKTVLDEKLDRDFLDSVRNKEEILKKKVERRQKHSENYDKKFQDLVAKMREASLADGKKENVPFLRKPTQSEMNAARDELEKEFASPSSTARMIPFTEQMRPRRNPMFGEKMVGLKSLVLPPSKPASTPTNPSSSAQFAAHETVFFPQAHDSFNLDSYNGSRPSFAFSGINGATSTPVSKGNFFGGGIAEEAGDDSVFESSKYVTAMESPIQNTGKVKMQPESFQSSEIRKVTRGKEATEIDQPETKGIETERTESKICQQKEHETPQITEFPRNTNDRGTVRNDLSIGAILGAQIDKTGNKLDKPDISINQNPNRFGRGLFSKPSQNTGFSSHLVENFSANEGGSTEQKTTAEKQNDDYVNSLDPKPSDSLQGSSVKSEPLTSFPSPSSISSELKVTPASEIPKLTNQLTSGITKSETVSQPAVQKAPTRPFALFKNYINLLSTLQTEKTAYETSSDPKFRAVLKRTITEKVTVFTQRETSSKARSEILEFFKSLLQKKEVQGFAIVGTAPVLQLKTDADVNYSVHCIVEKYISLAELDEELAPTISDLISRLSAVVRRVEKVFIVLMFNKSTLLRQNPEECNQKFVKNAENADQKAIEWNQEQALVTLFFTVFTKNAFIATKGRKMVLSDDLLWKYVETSVAHVLELPKAPFIILQLITTCKPLLHAGEARWIDMLQTIDSEILPELEEEPFPGDEAIIGRLRQMLSVLNG